MPVFTLSWDNTALVSNANSVAQRASYRRKSIGGIWFTAGFTPLNDLPTSAITCNSPDLPFNIVFEFRVQNICTTNGPTTNSNGPQDQIMFNCLAEDQATFTQTDIAATADLDVTGTDIIKAKFTLRKISDNSVVGAQTTVPVTANHIQKTFTGLVASTDYYWVIELIAVVNGIEVSSAEPYYVGSPCIYNITTAAPATCLAPSNLIVSTAL